MPDTMLSRELDRIIADHQLRIQQQRIHVRELSADPMSRLTVFDVGASEVIDGRQLRCVSPSAA